MKQKLTRQAAVKLPFVASIENDNGGMWFKAKSRVNAKQLKHAFAMHKVGVILYERVGGIVQGMGRTLYLQIQTVTEVIALVDWESKEPIYRTIPSYSKGEKPRPEWTVEVCLKDLGITLERDVPVTDVLAAYHGRRR